MDNENQLKKTIARLQSEVSGEKQRLQTDGVKLREMRANLASKEGEVQRLKSEISALEKQIEADKQQMRKHEAQVSAALRDVQEAGRKK